MTRVIGIILLSAAFLGGCSTTRMAAVDRIEVVLPASADKVKAAVSEVLDEAGYANIDWNSNQTLSTGYRMETSYSMNEVWDWSTWSVRRDESTQSLMSHPSWDVFYWSVFGAVKSSVQATVTPADNQSTRLQLQVESDTKDGIFSWWYRDKPQAPQSANNQIRLIKNALRIL
jgi:hypothetical protein